MTCEFKGLRCPRRKYGAANDNFTGAIISLSCEELAMEPEHAALLAKRFKERANSYALSRRQLSSWLAERLYFFDGEVLNADGTTYCICSIDIDTMLNNDASYRWYSDFFKMVTTKPKQRIQKRIVCRLRVIELALKIDDLKKPKFPPSLAA
jgi:hypothetical protein